MMEQKWKQTDKFDNSQKLVSLSCNIIINFINFDMVSCELIKSWACFARTTSIEFQCYWICWVGEFRNESLSCAGILFRHFFCFKFKPSIKYSSGRSQLLNRRFWMISVPSSEKIAWIDLLGSVVQPSDWWLKFQVADNVHISFKINAILNPMKYTYSLCRGLWNA